MPKPEWGVKRSCLSCGARFYDLNRDPIVCPKCGAEFDISALAKPRRMKPEKAETPAPAATAPAPASESETANSGASEEELIDEGDGPVSESADTASVDGDEDLGDFDSGALLEDEEDDDDLEGFGEVNTEEDEDGTS